MRDASTGAILYLTLWLNAPPRSARAIYITIGVKAGNHMERTDWLDEGMNSADACFLMLTAITHHKFSSPAWGEHEVRKLHTELAELDRLVTQAVAPGMTPAAARRRAA